MAVIFVQPLNALYPILLNLQEVLTPKMTLASPVHLSYLQVVLYQ